MDDKERIIQIIPASGWYAQYTDDTDADPLDPIVCFALVELTSGGSTWQEVRPMGADGKKVELVDTAGNFGTVIYRPNYGREIIDKPGPSSAPVVHFTGGAS